MARSPLPPLAATVSLIDCINRGDLNALAALMHPGHRLEVLGKPCRRPGCRGLCLGSILRRFPRYVIYPKRLAEAGRWVAVLGTTTGSHLDLPADAERQLA
jgi:hypothetical protein